MSVSASFGTNDVTPAFAPLPWRGSIAMVALLLARVLSIRNVPVSGFEREFEPTFAWPFHLTVIVCVWPGANVNERRGQFRPFRLPDVLEVLADGEAGEAGDTG